VSAFFVFFFAWGTNVYALYVCVCVCVYACVSSVCVCVYVCVRMRESIWRTELPKMEGGGERETGRIVWSARAEMWER